MTNSREPHRRGHGEDGAEDDALARADLAGDHRPVAGAVHLGVDVAVVDAVEGVGRAGAERAADEGRDDQPQRRNPLVRQEHHRDRRHEQQLDDARLGEREVCRGLAPAPGLPGTRRSGQTDRVRSRRPSRVVQGAGGMVRRPVYPRSGRCPADGTGCDARHARD